MSTLLATSGYHVGRRFTLGPVTRMGRAPDNEIVLPDNLVSRYHAEIQRSGLNYVVADLGSKNGIMVNEKRKMDHHLRRGDRIKIGQTTLVFEAPQELKTARFTNTLIHFDPDQDETMRVADRSAAATGETEEATQLILRLAQVFETVQAELPDVLNKILKHLLDLFGSTSGSIFLRGRGGEIVPLTAITEGDELHINREAAVHALEQGRAVLAASFFATRDGEQIQRRPRKAMIAPLFERENPFGAIHLERASGADYTMKDVMFLQALARLVSASIRQAMRIDQLWQARDSQKELIIGNSAQLVQLRSQIERIAGSDTTVLVTGETGTGKELVARELHERSARAGGPFVAINCAAIPETLIESELFGYERGAFTGADQMKRGKIEMADAGTLFLDEVGEMSPTVQPKLLRFLEERIFYRVGGTRPIQTDVRVITATNRNLEEEVQEGRFRQDLYYRLKVLFVETPPLRQRREDIRTLIQRFAPEYASKMGKPYVGIEDSAWRVLEAYDWPGNVRELLQSLERAIILSDTGMLGPEHFQIKMESPPAEVTDSTTGTQKPSANPERQTAPDVKGVPPTLAEVEKRAIIHALRYSEGNKNKAADLLQIHRNTLRKKMVEYGIKG